MGMLFGQNGIGFHRLGEGFALPLPQTLLQTIRLPQWVGLRRKRAHREPPRLESLEPRTLLAATPYISEFMANNDSILADQDGAFSDWIEIANPDVAKVNLNGYYLTDDATLLNKWKLPAVDLPAGGYMVVFASGKNRALAGSQLHTNFELNDAGEYLALVAPDGQTILSDFTPEYPQQLMDKSYGISKNLAISPLLPTGSPLYVKIPTDGTLGTTWRDASFIHTGWTSGLSGAGFDINTGPARLSGFTVRMVNVSGQITDVSQAEALLKTPFPTGWTLQQDLKADYAVVNHGVGGDFGSDQLLPNGLSNDDEYVLEATADVVIPQGSWTFNVGSDDGFKLTLSNGTFTGGLNYFSFPGLRGHANTSATINVGAGGLSTKLTLVFYENGGGDDVELSVASAGSGSLVLLSDGVLPGWSVKTSSSSPPPDYLPLVKTSLDATMRNKNASAYIRVPLKQVINPTDYDLLKLRMKYDDGFVAYLNGQKIYEKNAPSNPVWNSTATAAHPDAQAIVFEEFEIPLPPGLLQAGSGNVLAIQGLNQTASEGDFLIYPEMDGVKILGTAPRYFARPTPGQPNDISSLTEIVKDTKFSQNRGFFDTPFNLTIMTATPEAQIRYTLDGSAPTATTGIVFDANDPDPAKRTIRIDKTTTIRTAAFKAGAISSNVDTQTYIFLEDVIHQSPTGTPPAGWPTGPVNGQTLDYGMDTDVINDPIFGPQLKAALQSLPSFSVVMDVNDMFGPAGIYTNPGQDGRQWERPMSLELLYPDGTQGFHINGGVRVRGGYSRSTGNPKHALRFFFRDEYGEGKLNYPVFGADAAQEFSAFDLRTFQNYSWSFSGDGRGIFMRDQYNRDLQLAMNDPATRGNYYHLYINGQYWGLYNTEERAEAEYAASYFGGVKEDYDVIKVEAGPYTINATDGNMDAWTRLWNQAIGDMTSNANYLKLMGLNADGTRNSSYEVLLDADNLIDYMLLIFWGGNFDAPSSWFLGEGAPNNWYGIRNRNGQEGFKFFIHDAEHTLVDPNSGDVNAYLNVDRLTPLQHNTDLYRSNPGWLFKHLMDNAEFRLRVADRVQKFFFNTGVLAPANATALFNKRKNEIFQAVIAESARWGDAQRGGGYPLTRNDWLAEVNKLLNVYFPQRTNVVLNQLKTALLYPSVAAPVYNQHGGIIGSAFNLTLRNPDGIGTIYYTTDGADPRKLYGALNTPSAKAYSAAIALTGTTTVKARILDAGRWSALTEAVFHHDLSSLKVTELMYNPAPPRPAELAVNPLFTAQDFEFVEIRNTGSTQLDIGGVSFSAGLIFTPFPAGTKLAAGARVVLAKNASAFAARYPGITLGGIYTGSLDNGGERLVLSAPGGKTIFDFTYGDWYSITDGEGYSLVPINTAGDYNNKDNWRPSNKLYGAPGADDPGFLPDSVVINEALTHTDQPIGDWIELRNTTNGTLDLSGWFLSDSDLDLQKYRIPQGTVISPGGYVVLTQSQHFGTRFGLSEYGEDIFLSSSDGTNLGGYREHVDFGAADREVTFGRYLKSTGGTDFVPMAAPTLGSANALPRVGPVIISEIMYYPSAGGDEYVELLNLAGSDMPLYDPLNPQNPWKFLEGIDFAFPAGATLPAFGYGLVVGIDPAAFRTKYAVPAEVPIFGPYAGLLDNDGDDVKLAMPGSPDVGVPLPYILVDQVHYENNGAWPAAAYGTGPSLARKNATAYGNDAANWAAGPAGGTPGSVFVAPATPLELTATAINISLVRLTWMDKSTGESGFLIERSANGINFSQVGQVGSNVSTFDDSSGLSPGTFYTYRVRAYNAVGNSDYSNTFSATTPNIQTLPLVAANDAWRYNENRADPGATWITTGYNDAVSPWKSGPGPLGLDGDFPAGTFNTTLTIGNTNDRTKAFYFRKHFNLPVTPADVTDLQIRLFVDDGAAVYINGYQVPYLYYMDAPPQGSRLTYDSLANNTVGNAIWDGWFSLPAEMRSALLAGDNVIAVETHQANTGSSDIVFAMELQAIVSATTVSADIVNVSPDPTPDPINSITIQFSEKVNGFDRLDLRLTRDDDAADRLTDQQTLSSADGITWTLNNVAAVTALAGRYTLKLSANGAGIVGANTGRVLGADAIDVFKSTRMALTGSSGNDIYYVRVANSCLEIFPTVPPGLMPAWRFPLTDITSLSIDAGGGNDLLQLAGNMPFTIPFNGGDGTDRLILDGGTFAFAANLAGPASIEELVATSTATVNFTTSQTLASLTLSNSARVNLAAGGTLLLRTSGLSITNIASLDLNDNDLIVQAQSATRDTVLFQVNNLIRIARNDGAWDAPGLTSTTARNRADGLTGLAAALNDNGSGAKLWTNEDANAILVKYTWNGDVNLDGAINLNDYFLIDSGYLAKGKNYISGDVNYDGGVNLNDYFLIDSAYLAQSGLLNTTIPAASTAPPPRKPLSPAARPKHRRKSIRKNRKTPHPRTLGGPH